MKKIFIGFIFIFLDFHLSFGNSKIGLIPDFVGYLIMINGLVEMSDESMWFMKVKPYAGSMALYTGILYLLDLMGVSVSFGVLTYIFAIISTAISLYISYNIVMGVIDVEGKYSKQMNGDRLKSIWTLITVLDVLSFVLLLIPPAASICVIISFIAAICFLVAFNKSKNLYYSIR